MLIERNFPIIVFPSQIEKFFQKMIPINVVFVQKCFHFFMPKKSQTTIPYEKVEATNVILFILT